MQDTQTPIFDIVFPSPQTQLYDVLFRFRLKPVLHSVQTLSVSHLLQ